MIDPLFPLVPAIAVALVALGILLFLESRRKQKYVILRMLAQVLLVSSVLLLSLRPSIEQKGTDPSVLLLTQGYDQRVVDSLQSLTPVAFQSYNELSKLANVRVITGNGLPSWAVDLLPSKNYSFIPSSGPANVSAIDVDEHIYVHRWNEIRGSYSGEKATIKLRGPGGFEDSVEVSNGSFKLSFFAKAPGRFNYDVITSGHTETLPLVIEPERIFNIIFISNYPTFELSYLKNFLASKGHRLSIRNQVSRGLYKFEFANRPASNFNTLTSALLNETDLVVIDERSWFALSPNEQKNVRTSIDNGLGVIVIPEAKTEKHNSYLVHFTATQQKDTTRVSSGRAGSYRLPALALEVDGSTPLLTAADNRVLNGYSYSGNGKIGYQLLNETYQVGLQGNAEAYAGLWVPLMEKCARAGKNDLKLKITSPFPHYENEPLSFDIISSGKEPKLTIDNIDFPLTEDVFIDDLWHGTTWLDGNRWHEFEIDSAITPVYVTKAGAWASVRTNNNKKATSLKAGRQEDTSGPLTTYDDRLVKIVLFIIFLAAGGFLWLAPKL